jgi:hypothetical protein
MGSMLSLRSWVVFTILWAIFIGALVWQGWPRLPLDTGNDAATQALLDAAIRDHMLVHAGLAIVPPLIMLGVGRILLRMRGRQG